MWCDFGINVASTSPTKQQNNKTTTSSPMALLTALPVQELKAKTTTTTIQYKTKNNQVITKLCYPQLSQSKSSQKRCAANLTKQKKQQNSKTKQQNSKTNPICVTYSSPSPRAPSSRSPCWALRQDAACRPQPSLPAWSLTLSLLFLWWLCVRDFVRMVQMISQNKWINNFLNKFLAANLFKFFYFHG